VGIDHAQDPSHPELGRASWYAQGVSDAVGDRLLMFDNTGGPSLELLRFSWKVTALPGFEEALRERVEVLSQFRHPSFAKVRAVEKLEPKNDLTLVSNYVPGKRLSEGLAALRGPAFAMWLIRDLVPALAALQQQGRGVAHGALTADRIVLTSDGGLVIVEHVLGSALERLQLSPNELWVRFGIGVPPSAGDRVALDCQTDVFQLGLVALSVLLGRSLASYEYPHGLGALLDRFQESAGRELPATLRMWLNRALHLGDKPFESARDAHDGLGELEAPTAVAELPGDSIFARAPQTILKAEQALTPASERSSLQKSAFERSVLERSSRESVAIENPAIETPENERPVIERPVIERPAVETQAEDFTAPPHPVGRTTRRIEIAPLNLKRKPVGPSDLDLPGDPTWQREVVAADLLSERRLEMGQRYSRGRIAAGPWALAGLGLLVLAQAGYIAYLLYSPAPPVVIQAPQTAAPVTAVRSTPEAQIPPAVTAAEPLPAVSAPVRSGGVRVNSQVEVQLLDGDRVLGSSADGPIVTTAGRHEFELVNSALGYRARQVVTVKPGEVISLNVRRPEGRLSVNAVPWADVWIDGNHIGETPLANLAIGIGQHDVAFRHPTLGEQRRTTIVRFDVPTRLSADLR